MKGAAEYGKCYWDDTGTTMGPGRQRGPRTLLHPPTPLILKTPIMWYIIIYFEYLILGGWGVLD